MIEQSLIERLFTDLLFSNDTLLWGRSVELLQFFFSSRGKGGEEE